MRQIRMAPVTYCGIPLMVHYWIDCRCFTIPMAIYRYDHEGD